MDSPLAPPAGGLRRRLALPALVVGVLALLFVANDRFVAHGREVVVLNRTGLSAQIQAPGLEPITLADKGFRVLVLGEGLHTIQVQLGERPARDVEVPVVGSVLDRLMGGRVFLLNLDAAAPIVWEETVYGPPGEKPTLAPTRIELGEVLVFERVDEVLVPFPDDSPEGPRVRIGVA
ncbi:MAG: hypothetical protein JKY65_30605, partial [Planctomycetes bacterium]|nr:hypothetical protein [Planctomycetota bacterium]